MSDTGSTDAESMPAGFDFTRREPAQVSRVVRVEDFAVRGLSGGFPDAEFPDQSPGFQKFGITAEIRVQFSFLRHWHAELFELALDTA